MRLFVLVVALVLCAAGNAHAELKSKVSCRGNPNKDEMLSQIQRYLKPGAPPLKETIFIPTYDLEAMKRNLPSEGLINNEAVAVALGQIVLARVYGEKIIEDEKPFEAHLIDNDVWIVERMITDEMVENCILATIFHSVAIRKSDGAILGVRLDK